MRGSWLRTALDSEYDFDRIAAYLYQEKRRPSELIAALEPVRRQFERRRIQPKATYMPLHYSLRALSTAPELGSRREDVERELGAISKFLLDVAGKQKTDPLFSAIKQVRKALAAVGRRDRRRR